ncbi:MAG: hypothetical protein EA397_18130 [Deltaproteobacteria bacterium]|nr:MAG: hypothetical protein EA397_18130 [Deltaproteobacteria bacterium]
MRLALVALWSVACSGLSGGQVCTQIGCESGLTVEIEGIESWPAGDYVVRASVDGESVQCEGSIPLNPCDQGYTFTCSDGVARISESGCDLPEREHGLSHVHFLADAAREVSLRIERDGELLGEQTFEPSYETFQPNGPECEPTCRQAQHTLQLQP